MAAGASATFAPPCATRTISSMVSDSPSMTTPVILPPMFRISYVLRAHTSARKRGRILLWARRKARRPEAVYRRA